MASRRSARSFCSTTPAYRAAPARFRPLASKWGPTRSLLSRRWDCRRSMCSGFRSAALSRRRSPVRRLVLVGTGPRSGEGMATLTPEAQEIFGATYDKPDHLWLRVHFTRSEKSQAAGREFLKRFRLRAENRDPEVNEKVAPAQIEAISKWGAPQEKPFEYLKSIRHPTLVINGSNDAIIYTVNSFILQQNLPNAQLILYPDSNHGSQYQYPALFVADVTRFLDAAVPFPIQKDTDHD